MEMTQGAITLSGVAFQRNFTIPLPSFTPHLETTILEFITPSRFQIWAFSASLAVTREIIVIFFSSAY